jgi:hypothetical protein
MAMKQLSKAIGIAALAASGVTLADTPTLKEVLDVSGISVTGYVDAAYTHHSIDPQAQTTSSGNSIPLLNYFDDDQNSFGVKQGGLTISSLPKEGFGALVNITAGSDADKIHSYGGSDSSNFDLTQAYVQYATGPLTIIGGKFNTLAGAEVIDPTLNTNISRSIAFLNALPFTHTGVRVAYAPMDGLTLYAGLNNGWDQQKDLNTSKTLELGAIWSPVSAITWAASLYNGKELITDPLSGDDTNTNRFLFDTVLTIKPTDALSLVLNYDYGKQDDAVANSSFTDTKDAKWTALVGYVNYQFTDEWRASLRGEVFDDKDGKIGLYELQDDGLGGLDNTGPLSKKSKEVTLTVGYAPSKNFEVRAEVRKDKTDKDVYIDGSSSTDTDTFFAAEAIYKF